jgi:O-antigen/teichoic acid export membrane protein
MASDGEVEQKAAAPQLAGLLKHSAIYSAAPFLRNVIALGMTVFYTDWLRTDGYGVKDVVDFWMVGLQQILGFNILGAIVRFYYDKKTPEERARTVTSCTLLVTVFAWIVCGIAFAFSPELKPLMLGEKDMVSDNDLVGCLRLMFVLIPFQLATLSGLYYLMAIKRSRAFTTIQTVKLLFEIGMNFILIGHFDMGVEGFLLSILAGEALTSLFLLGWMFRRLGVHFDLKVLKPILAYALPLIPVGVCQLALHTLDRRLLIELSPTDNEWDQAGIYSLAYRIGFLVTAMLLGPFVQIWHPWIYGIEDAKERAMHVAKVGTWAVATIGAASLGVIVFGRQVTMILDWNGDFWDAYLVIPYIAGGYVFWALYHVSQLPLFIAKRTGRLFVINLIAVAINVGLNLYLIPRQQFVGAGIATALTFVALAAMGMIASRSVAEVRFEVRRLTMIVATVTAGGAFTLWLDQSEAAGEVTLLVTLAVKAAALLVLIATLWFGVLYARERRELSGWIGTRLRGLKRA